MKFKSNSFLLLLVRHLLLLARHLLLVVTFSCVFLFSIVTGATLVVTGALLVVTMFAIRLKFNFTFRRNGEPLGRTSGGMLEP